MQRIFKIVFYVVASAFYSSLPIISLAQPPIDLPSGDDAETVATSTKQELIAKFLALNPDAHLHILNMDANGYDDSKEKSGLRLNKIWVGALGTLLELEGMPVTGRTASAIIRENTFQLVHKKGIARLQGFEGASYLKDRRGGGAIVVKPGEKLLAFFEAVDDSHPIRVEHVANSVPYVYFDGVDPHFKARYVAGYRAALANTASPEQMKDFLVEFASNDPEKKSRDVFLRLINAMRAQKTFEGYYNSYLLIQDPEDARKALALAQTNDHHIKLENIAVSTLADKNRLFDFDFSLFPSKTSSSEGSCLMFCNYNFSADRPLSGRLSVRLRSNSPIKLKQGTYKVIFSTQISMPRRKIRESSWLGNYDGADNINTSREVVVELTPPSYTASIETKLGSLNVAFFQRGSAGGYEGAWASSNATIQFSIKSVELVK